MRKILDSFAANAVIVLLVVLYMLYDEQRLYPGHPLTADLAYGVFLSAAASFLAETAKVLLLKRGYNWWHFGICAVTPLVNRDTSNWHDRFGLSAGLMSQAVVTILAADWLFAWLLFPVFLPFTYMRSRLVLVSELCCAISLYGCLLAPNIYSII